MTITDLNENNQFVGNISGTAFVYANEAYRLLSGLPGDTYYVQANAINDSGVIVGESDGEMTGERAVVFKAGVAIDLNTLIPAGTGIVLTDATAINNTGQIVVNGTLNGRQRVFLLDPMTTTVPEPRTIAVVFGGLASMAAARWRKRRS
jgi:probable HAF family extracellular repeat protein